MERVVKPRDRTRGVAKGRMRGHVLDLLAINVNLAAVAQALEIFGPGKRPALSADGVLAFDPLHEGFSLILPPRLARSRQADKGSITGPIIAQIGRATVHRRSHQHARGVAAPSR